MHLVRIMLDTICVLMPLCLGFNRQRSKTTGSISTPPSVPVKSLKPESLLRYFETKEPWRSPDLRLPEVIKELHTNRTYLSQVLKQDLHTNYADFVNRYRVKEAMQLMDQSGDQLKLSEISERCGFKYYATFSEVFHKMTGRTPTEYLQMNRVKRTG